MPISFSLSESLHLSGDHYSWRLKDGELRYRGTGRFEGLVLRRIPASDDFVLLFLQAIDLLQAWDWRSDYNAIDAEALAFDGGSWTFSMQFDGREICARGDNGFPSISDPKITSLSRGRFALLIAAMYDCFKIETYIHQAKLHAERITQIKKSQLADDQKR